MRINYVLRDAFIIFSMFALLKFVTRYFLFSNPDNFPPPTPSIAIAYSVVLVVCLSVSGLLQKNERLKHLLFVNFLLSLAEMLFNSPNLIMSLSLLGYIFISFIYSCIYPLVAFGICFVIESLKNKKRASEANEIIDPQKNSLMTSDTYWNLAERQTISSGFFIASLVFYSISLALPAYETTSHCKSMGITTLIFGPLGIITKHYSWIANPLLLTSWVLRKIDPRLSFLAAIVSVAFALSFPFGSKISCGFWDGVAEPYVANSGYYMWLLSIGCAAVAALINRTKN